MLISSRSVIWQWAELSKCGGGWLATAAVCVEEKGGREVGSGGGNGLFVNRRDITGTKQNKYYSNGTSENYNTSKLSTSLRIAEHSPSNADNTTRQPTRVTANAILIATLAHYTLNKNTLKTLIKPAEFKKSNL